MRVATNSPGGLTYRTCEGGDEAALFAARRGDATPPTYAAVIADLSAQMVADDAGNPGPDGGAVGVRVLIAEEDGVTLGVVRVDFDTNPRPTVSAWTVPTVPAEFVLALVGDGQVYARDCGAEAVDVEAHVRAFTDYGGNAHAAEVRYWTADPIPEYPLGLPRDLTYNL